MRQTIQLAGLLAQKHHGRGSRPGGTAVAPNMLSSLGGGGLPGHPAGQEKSLLCLQVSLPLTSSNSSLLEDLAGEPVFTAPFALDLFGL